MRPRGFPLLPYHGAKKPKRPKTQIKGMSCNDIKNLIYGEAWHTYHDKVSHRCVLFFYRRNMIREPAFPSEYGRYEKRKVGDQGLKANERQDCTGRRGDAEL